MALRRGAHRRLPHLRTGALEQRGYAGHDMPAGRDRLRHGHAVLGTWTAPGGGTVVTTGCTEWAYGLGDPVVARITRTIVDRLGGRAG